MKKIFKCIKLRNVHLHVHAKKTLAVKSFEIFENHEYYNFNLKLLLLDFNIQNLLKIK